MTEKHNNATRNRPEGDRTIDAPSLFIDLPAYIRQIKSEDEWRDNDRNSITVFKTGAMRIVLGGLHKDAELPPHKADGIMSLQVIDGSLEVNTDEFSSIVHTGEMIAIHKGSNYRVIALLETIYLLTLSDVG